MAATYGLTLLNLKQYIFVSVRKREVIMYFASEGLSLLYNIL